MAAGVLLWDLPVGAHQQDSGGDGVGLWPRTLQRLHRWGAGGSSGPSVGFMMNLRIHVSRFSKNFWVNNQKSAEYIWQDGPVVSAVNINECNTSCSLVPASCSEEACVHLLWLLMHFNHSNHLYHWLLPHHRSLHYYINIVTDDLSEKNRLNSLERCEVSFRLDFPVWLPVCCSFRWRLSELSLAGRRPPSLDGLPEEQRHEGGAVAHSVQWAATNPRSRLNLPQQHHRCMQTVAVEDHTRSSGYFMGQKLHHGKPQ